MSDQDIDALRAENKRLHSVILLGASHIAWARGWIEQHTGQEKPNLKRGEEQLLASLGVSESDGQAV